MIRYIKTFEVIFSTNNLSGMHISTMWHSLNVLKYFCPLSVYQRFSTFFGQRPLSTIYPRCRPPPESLNILLHFYLFYDNKDFLLVELMRIVYLSVMFVDNIFTSGFISVSSNLKSPH